MKKLYIYATLFILSLIFTGLHWNCSRPDQAVHQEEEISEKMLPHEWMYAQRAYPDNQINKDAIEEAYRMTVDARSDIQNRQTGSWELAGPTNVGGRITDIALHPTDQNIIYIGTSVGGVFKSTDRGATWQPVFEEEGGMSIGNLALAPSTPNTLYVGSGEANGSATSGAFFGDGIYKTTDGGATWEFKGLSNTQHIGRIVVDPANADRAYVAAAGILYGKNEERGLFRTTNGGESWEKILYISDSTSVIDVAINPENASIVYAATWERIRKPWGRRYGGKTSRIYRSLDGGENWQQVTEGLPEDNEQTGRIGLAVSPSEPMVVYASYTDDVVTNVFNGFYKSTDAGSSWNRVDESTNVNSVFSFFGWFFGNIRVHPTNPDDVSLLGLELMRSLDGGRNWADATFNMHVDFHALEFHPANPQFIVAGNDGGVYLSEDGGYTWNHVKGIPNNLAYNCEIDFLEPEKLYVGLQDQGTQRTFSGEVDEFGRILGGDGFQIIVDPTDNNFVYAEFQFGRVHRSVTGGFNMQCIFDCPPNNDPNLRTNWNTPIAMHPDDPTVIYVGAQSLFKGEDRGSNFFPISGDLTDGLHPSGSLSYGTITTIGLAPSDPQTIYVGTDDGNVQVTFDGGTNWTNISNGIPDRFVTGVAVHPEDPLTAYVSLSGYRNIDYQPHLQRTTNGGDSWEDVSAGLPEIPINDIIVHPYYPKLLFIANDLGVWYSDDAGEFWEILGDNMPFTVVNDLDLHEEEKFLLAATFGRSMLKFDITDLEPVSTNEEFYSKQPLTFYPNPATSLATVSFETNTSFTGNLQLISLNGQLIKSYENQRFVNGKNEMVIDLTGMNKGTYIVRVKGGKGIMTGKLVKK
ncbi:MAG: T9SS type A sorting domain-containing protein [Bacteroidota bacterium]